MITSISDQVSQNLIFEIFSLGNAPTNVEGFKPGLEKKNDKIIGRNYI